MSMDMSDLSGASTPFSFLRALGVLSREINGALVMRAAGTVLSAIAGIGLTLAPNVTQATTWTVTTLADPAGTVGPCDADCTLREAIASAQSDDVINFMPGLTGTIALRGLLGTSRNNVTVAGPGAHLITLDANFDPSDPQGEFRIFRVLGIVQLLTIKGLTLQNGYAAGSAGGAIYAANDLVLDGVVVQNSHADTDGGGVFVLEGDLTLIRSSFRGNTATQWGGGFYASARATLSDSTISGNTSEFGGGGFLVGGTAGNAGSLTNSTVSGNSSGSGGGGFYSSMDITLTNSTVSDNSAVAGGGMFVLGGDVTGVNSTISGNSAANEAGGILCLGGCLLTLRNSLVAGNTAATLSEWYEFQSDLVSASYSLIESSSTPQVPNGTNGNITLVDPELGPLQDNGGPTLTRALSSTSPALDAGQNSTCAATDQRGIARPQDGDGNGSKTCDMGAAETVIDPVFADSFEGTPTR